jgi:hypothetical protein
MRDDAGISLGHLEMGGQPQMWTDQGRPEGIGRELVPTMQQPAEEAADTAVFMENTLGLRSVDDPEEGV